MSTFELEYSALGGIRSRVQGVGNGLSDCSARLRRQVSLLSGQYGFGIETVRSNINRLSSDTSALSQNAYAIAAFLTELEKSVIESENQAYSILAGTVPGEEKLTDGIVAWGPGNATGLVEAGSKPEWLEALLEMAGEFGYVGNAISFISGLIDASGESTMGAALAGIAKSGWDAFDNLYDLYDDLKKPVVSASSAVIDAADIKKAVGPAAQTASGTVDAAWKDKLFGFQAFEKQSFKEALGIDALKGAEGGAKAALAWGGIALDGVVNFFKNKEEHGGITGRAVAETISETAIDIAKGAAITAAVGAAATALGVVAAPAVVIGAIGVGVTIGLDFASEKIFGKDLTELVSDFVLDTGVKIGEAAKETFNSAANCFTNAIGNIAAGWSAAFGF